MYSQENWEKWVELQMTGAVAVLHTHLLVSFSCGNDWRISVSTGITDEQLVFGF